MLLVPGQRDFSFGCFWTIEVRSCRTIDKSANLQHTENSMSLIALGNVGIVISKIALPL